MAKSVRKPAPKKATTQKNPEYKKPGLSNPVKYILLSALLVLTALVYLNGLHGDMLNFDDVEYFANYPEVLELSWKNVAAYFSNYYVIMYQPLPVLTFALNYHFTGMDTFPMHLVNLCFHLFNIMLVYILIKKISSNFYVAIIVTALFALHPMNVEAVTWISARSSGMYTLFYLAALIFYVDYIKKGCRWKHLIPVLCFFILSLFSKAQAVTLPVLLLLIDFYFARKLISVRTLTEKIPFFALSFVFGIIAISDTSTMVNITQGMMVEYSFFDGIFLICYSFVFYLYKLFIPFSLAAVYVYPPKENGLLPWAYYASPAILAVIAWYIIKYARKSRYFLFGLGVFLVTIALNIQIIPSRLFIVTERYAYFPYIGLFFIAGMYYTERMRANQAFRKLKPLLIVLFVVYLSAFAFTVFQRNKVWQNDIVFMTDILKKNPEVPYLSRAYGNRGHVYSQMEQYGRAIDDFTEAIRLNPADGQSWFNRGLCYNKTGDYAKAVADFDSALRYQPEVFVILSNRAVATYNMEDYTGTIEACNEAIAADSTQYEIYNTRAAARFFLGDYMNAEQDFTRSIALNPDYPDSYKNRGNLYFKLNRLEEACADWAAASSAGNTDAQRFMAEYCK